MSGIGPVPSNPAAPSTAWTFARVLALLGGAVLSYIAIRYSRGIGLAGFLGVLLLVAVQGRRGRRASRGGAWLAACAASAGTIAVILTVGFAKLPSDMLSQMADSVRAAQRRGPPAALPPALQRLQPNDSASRAAAQAAQEQAMSVLSSPVFLRGMTVFTIVMTSSILGVLLGTLAWGGGAMLTRGLRGFWPLPPAPPEEEGAR